MRSLFGAALLMLLAGEAFPQAQMSSGNITGTIRDRSNAVLPGASVTIINTETGVRRPTTTDTLGGYRFLVLPPGMYELKAELPGFAPHSRRQIKVTVGETVLIDAQLQPAGLQQEIVVQQEMTPLETAKVQQSDTITKERIDNLPINERDFLKFTLLTPGVTDAMGLVTFSLPQTASSDLSFLGQSGRSNSVTIDGVDNNDNAVATVRSTLSQEAVEEFQINRANYSAEFGRASGGLINIVSKSGTNTWHGRLFTFWRDDALDAKNAFAHQDSPFSRQQAGFALGGPVKRDRTFVFLSHEGRRQRESRFVSFLDKPSFFEPTPSQLALITWLAESPLPTLRAFAPQAMTVLTTNQQSYPATLKLLSDNSGAFPYKNNDNLSSLRLDHSISTSNQMFGRVTFGDVDTSGAAVGGLRGPSRGANYNIQDQSAVFGDTHFYGPKNANEFRFQFSRRYYGVQPADPVGPEISINGLALLGRDFFLPSIRSEKRYQFVENFTHIAGRHELKVGGDVHYLPFNTVTEVFLGGRFIFGEGIPLNVVLDSFVGAGTSQTFELLLRSGGRSDLVPALSAPITALQAFNFGLPIVYQQGFGNPQASLSNKLVSAYVQDAYRPTSNLTINLGLRYDQELQPAPVHRDKNNWGPRIGFAYNATPRSVIRGGYGVYYSTLYEAVAFVQRVLDGSQISQVFVPITGLPQLGISSTSADVWALAQQVGASGNRVLTSAEISRLGLSPGVTPRVLFGADPGIVDPYSQQFSLGVDRELSGGINLSVNYLANRGTKLLRSRNVNIQQVGVSPYGAIYGPAFGPLNPGILQNNQVESSGNSIYHGMALSVIKRYSSNYQFQVSYTLSKAIDDTTDFIPDLQPANQMNLRNERGLSTWDQRHRLVVSGVVSAPFDENSWTGKILSGVTLAPIVTYSSGHPFNLLLGFDANNDTQANTDRPPHAGRNTARGPNFFNVDLRLAKDVQIKRESNYRIEGILEAFNLFNRVNFSGVNNTLGSCDARTQTCGGIPIGQYRVRGRRDVGPADPLGFTTAFDPRQIQIGVKFKF